MLDELHESDGHAQRCPRASRWPPRPSLHRALRHRDQPLVHRARGRRLPAAARPRVTRRSSTCPTARTPTSAPPTTSRSAPAWVCCPGPAAPRQADLLQQHARPRLGAQRGARLRRPGLRDRQAQQPVRRGGRRRTAGRPTSGPSRAIRSAPTAASSRSTAASTARRRALAEQFVEVLFAPGLRRRRARDPHPEAERPHPRGPGAPAPLLGEPRSARSPAGCSSRTATTPSTTREHDGGRHRARARPSSEWADLLFAWRVGRHVKSNAIVLADDRATVGIGAGQMSRVDSVQHRRREVRDPRQRQGAVLASDAFFPFADGPELAIQAGSPRSSSPAAQARRRGRRRRRRGRRRDGPHRAPPLPPLMRGRSGTGRAGPTRTSSATAASSAAATTCGSRAAPRSPRTASSRAGRLYEQARSRWATSSARSSTSARRWPTSCARACT